MENTKLIKNYKRSYYWSIAFLALVIIITLWLFFYNNNLVSKHEKLNDEITQKTNELKKDLENPKIQLYKIINRNKEILDRLENNSKVTKFIDHLNYIEDIYDINFSWFSLNSSIIWTEAIIITDEYTDIDYKLAYQKFTNFVSKYRADENALFELEFINRISWQDELKFNLNFIIK